MIPNVQPKREIYKLQAASAQDLKLCKVALEVILSKIPLQDDSSVVFAANHLNNSIFVRFDCSAPEVLQVATFIALTLPTVAQVEPVSSTQKEKDEISAAMDETIKMAQAEKN